MSEKAEFPRQYIDAIIQECGLQRQAILHALELMVNGASIPFIARYRKEATDSMDELQLVLVRDSYLKLQAVDERRQAIMTSILEQGKMSEPLLKLLQAAMSKVELEDLYLPYKPKRKTRSSVALEKGLEPLAKSIMGQDFALDIMQEASKFIDPSKGVNTVEEALSGARDIMADWINETAMARNQIRKLYKNSYIVSNVVEGMAEQGANYSVYFQRREALMKTPSHRVLAMFRGEAEGFLKIRIEPDEQACLNALYFLFVKNTTHSGNQVALAIKDSFKRLMGPSMENEYRKLVKSKAEKAAIKVFAKNLEQLLLAPPLGEKAVLAIDPGFRTGCKVVCLDKQGKLLHNETIFPHPPHNQVSLAIAKILHLVEVYKIEAIAIGNGTAGRETEDFIKKIKFRSPVIAVIVNESGASIYSASVVAREEFGDYDITVRGAVSIGRRLLDPLSELVKVDPKSIGVGQYQHDVDATDLQVALTDTVVSCVNRVGVELNTASKELLSYVSGLTPTVAENIV
ncbi:MAG: Tex-like N-terminal domain-containing protein, partial [Bacteroidales bacterium]